MGPIRTTDGSETSGLLARAGRGDSDALGELFAQHGDRLLGIKEKAAGMRYVRALKQRKEILTSLLGGLLEP